MKIEIEYKTLMDLCQALDDALSYEFYQYAKTSDLELEKLYQERMNRNRHLKMKLENIALNYTDMEQNDIPVKL